MHIIFVSSDTLENKKEKKTIEKKKKKNERNFGSIIIARLIYINIFN